MTQQTSLTHTGRDLGLDTARAVATVAMVVGHTLDALLEWSLRGDPVVATYWRFRGLTAPMFLLVSGWAVATVIARSRATGLDAVKTRLPRIGLLFACGLLLRLPTWGWRQLLAGDEAVWRHTIGFDALHCVAASMLVGTVLLAAFPSPRGRITALVAAAAVAVFAAEPLWGWLAHAPLVMQQWLGAGNAPFTVFPWAGYFLAGAAVGAWSAQGLDPRKRAAVLTAVGLALFAAGYGVAARDAAITDVRLFSLRLGQVLVFAGAFGLLPAWVGHRAAPLGRATLGIYLVHVAIIYGWASFPGLSSRIGATLQPVPAILLGVTLLVFSYGVTVGWARARAWTGRTVRERLAVADPAA